MKVARDPAELERRPRAVALGTFDGVHRGHRAVLEAALAAGPAPTVVTFDPHPRVAFGNRVDLITALDRRLELIAETGIEEALVVHFDLDVGRLEPEEFAESVLRAIGAEVIVAGEDFRFGRGRRGDPELLRRLGFETRRAGGRGRVVDGDPAARPRRRDRGGGRAARPAARGRRRRRLGRRARRHARLPDREPLGRGGVPRARASGSTRALPAGIARRSRSARTRTTAARSGESRRSCSTSPATSTAQRLVVEIWQRLRDERVFDSEAALIAQIAVTSRPRARPNGPSGRRFAVAAASGWVWSNVRPPAE